MIFHSFLYVYQKVSQNAEGMRFEGQAAQVGAELLVDCTDVKNDQERQMFCPGCWVGYMMIHVVYLLVVYHDLPCSLPLPLEVASITGELG